MTLCGNNGNVVVKRRGPTTLKHWRGVNTESDIPLSRGPGLELFGVNGGKSTVAKLLIIYRRLTNEKKIQTNVCVGFIMSGMNRFNAPWH